MLYYGAMGLTILASLFYHLFQKATPAQVHPLIGLAVTYAVALIICLLLLPFFPLGTSLGAALRQVNWASVALALAVVGIELGFLLAYRAGWNISIGALVTNVAVTVLLVPIGVALFAETLAWTQIVGICVCVVGLVLINIRP
ncbi:MAG: EamA family transporter [Kouleothrix sp.]